MEHKFKVGDRVVCRGTIYEIYRDATKYPYRVEFSKDDICTMGEASLELASPQVPPGWTPASEPPNNSRSVKIIFKNSNRGFGYFTMGGKEWMRQEVAFNSGGTPTDDIVAWQEIHKSELDALPAVPPGWMSTDEPPGGEHWGRDVEVLLVNGEVAEGVHGDHWFVVSLLKQTNDVIAWRELDAPPAEATEQDYTDEDICDHLIVEHFNDEIARLQRKLRKAKKRIKALKAALKGDAE